MIEFKDKLQRGASQLGIYLDDAKLEKFYLYQKLILEWNQKINLTAIEEKEIIVKHFLDSLVVGKIFDLADWSNVLDVGTGAGFPGIPLKITYPHLNITLMDSTQKKVDFLAVVIADLKLQQVSAVHTRAEEMGSDAKYREKFSVVLSRAVAALNILGEYCLPLVELAGKMIAYKSQDIAKEISQSEPALQKLGGKIESVSHETLPLSTIVRSIVVIEKISKTPLKYPRRVGVPKKKPLK